MRYALQKNHRISFIRDKVISCQTHDYTTSGHFCPSLYIIAITYSELKKGSQKIKLIFKYLLLNEYLSNSLEIFHGNTYK